MKFSIADESAYKALTEEYIIEKIKETNGDIDRKKLIEDVVALYSWFVYCTFGLI